MRASRLLIVSLVGLVLLMDVSQIHACGDKFLVRLERDAQAALPQGLARHSATILVYRPVGGHGAPQAVDLESLASVGHQVFICDTAERCVTAVASGDVQIVLGDYRDLEELSVDKAAPGTRFLPVASGIPSSQFRQLRAAYGQVFDGGAPTGKLLAMVDRLARR